MTDEELFQPLDEATLEDQLPGWYEKWRERIRLWVSEHVDDALADVLLLVPDLLALLVGLSTDKRVPLMLKAQIVIAIAYVVSPVDLIPEAVLGVTGLADDVGVMAVLLYSITNLHKIDPQVIREHWHGEGDPLEVIKRLQTFFEENADKILDSKIWTGIRERFGQISLDENSEGALKRLWQRFSRKPSQAEEH